MTRWSPERWRCVLPTVSFLFFVGVIMTLYAGNPVLTDPRIPSGEWNLFRLTKSDGTIASSTHHVTIRVDSGEEFYVIRTDAKRMVLRKRDMTPISIEKDAPDGTVDWRIEYGPDRVRFIYPGPKRNRVEKVDRNRYDVNAIVHVVRGFPFREKKQVKFQLVTQDRILGVYLKQVGEERIVVEAGTFESYKIEAGLTGLKGRLYKRKIYFWVEKEPPHRLVRQEDEGVTDVRVTELVKWGIDPSEGTP